VSAYGFTENQQFAVKTDRNYIFLGRDPHMLDQLYTMVPYKSFIDFQKNQIFAQNPMILAYGFTENSQFTAKTDRNFIFLGRDPHITNLQYLMVQYMSFYGFQKNYFFAQNP
jgi:hypothetical protein